MPAQPATSCPVSSASVGPQRSRHRSVSPVHHLLSQSYGCGAEKSVPPLKAPKRKGVSEGRHALVASLRRACCQLRTRNRDRIRFSRDGLELAQEVPEVFAWPSQQHLNCQSRTCHSQGCLLHFTHVRQSLMSRQGSRELNVSLPTFSIIHFHEGDK